MQTVLQKCPDGTTEMSRQYYRNVHTLLQKCTGSTTGDITEMY